MFGECSNVRRCATDVTHASIAVIVAAANIASSITVATIATIVTVVAVANIVISVILPASVTRAIIVRTVICVSTAITVTMVNIVAIATKHMNVTIANMSIMVIIVTIVIFGIKPTVRLVWRGNWFASVGLHSDSFLWVHIFINVRGMIVRFFWLSVFCLIHVFTCLIATLGRGNCATSVGHHSDSFLHVIDVMI